MITREAWLAKVVENKEVLKSLLEEYHPAEKRKQFVSSLPITAPTAEAACVIAREHIRHGYIGGSPVQEFEIALDSLNVDALSSLLNQAWFGVPESTQCWSIPGFREAVDLIEDMPEE